MPAQLLSLTDGPSILLDKPVVLIGRHEECDLQLNSRKVSRKHCCLAQVNDHLLVRDLGSTNGVRINGVRVTEGVLRTGDELTIGNYRYRVHCDASHLVAAPPPVPAVAVPAQNDGLESLDMPVPLPDGKNLPGRPPPTSESSVPIPDVLRPERSSAHGPPK